MARKSAFEKIEEGLQEALAIAHCDGRGCMPDVLTVLNMFEEEARKLREKHRKHTMADPALLGYKPAAEIIERTVQKVLDEIQAPRNEAPLLNQEIGKPKYPAQHAVTPFEESERRVQMQNWYKLIYLVD